MIDNEIAILLETDQALFYTHTPTLKLIHIQTKFWNENGKKNNNSELLFLCFQLYIKIYAVDA